MPVQPRAGIYAPKPARGEEGGKLSITLVKSTIGQIENQKLTVKALGLRRMHQTVIRPDTPSVRGMVYTVRHLVRVEAADADAPKGVVRSPKRGTGARVVSSSSGGASGASATGTGAAETGAAEAAAPATGATAGAELQASADGGTAPGSSDATA
jgi:large subunit ribosomal protein L30